MPSYCFWILKNGNIIKPDSRHILAVVASPAVFGETEDSIRKTFNKYGQDIASNFEGKAREEVLLRVIRRNHIRIRKNQSKQNQHWSIQLYKLEPERIASIASWAKQIFADLTDPYSDVVIHQLYDDTKYKTSFNHLLEGVYDRA